ncbi:unnamed protein product, partial [Dovyalis caffra]
MSPVHVVNTKKLDVAMVGENRSRFNVLQRLNPACCRFFAPAPAERYDPMHFEIVVASNVYKAKSKPIKPQGLYESTPVRVPSQGTQKGKVSTAGMGATYDNDRSHGRLSDPNDRVASLSGDTIVDMDRLDVAQIPAEIEIGIHNVGDSDAKGPPSNTREGGEQSCKGTRLDRASRRIPTRSGRMRTRGGGSR